MNQTATIYSPDGKSQTLEANRAADEVRKDPRKWSFAPPPPRDWEKQLPRYRVTRDLQPSPKARHRLEPPFATVFDSHIWQYGDRLLEAGEVIESRAWPHASFQPLNYSAQRVLAFFNSSPKSRLPVAAWHGDRLRLDNGFSGSGITAEAARSPRLEPMNLRPIA